MKLVKFLFVISAMMLFTGCVVAQDPTTRIEFFESYIPTKGTVHSEYPIQFLGQPLTANERLQAESRGPVNWPVVSCTNGNAVVTVIGNMVQFDPADKKKWPRYGYVVNEQKVIPAADGTNSYELYYKLEHTKHKDRNEETGYYGTSTFRLNWNEEVMEDGWMHGEHEYRGTSVYIDYRLVKVDSERETYDMRCKYLNTDEIATFRKKMAQHTMTEEQLEMLSQ